MTPNSCPLFDGCSAPICPLDKDALHRKMLRDERVCHYIYKAIDEPNSDDVIVYKARQLKESTVLRQYGQGFALRERYGAFQQINAYPAIRFGYFK